MSGIAFYVAFSYFRLACIIQGVYSRALGGAQGDTDDDVDLFRTRSESSARLAESSPAPSDAGTPSRTDVSSLACETDGSWAGVRDRPGSAAGPLLGRAELTMFLVPMALAFSLAQLAKTLWPTLLAEAPWTLLVMSVNTTRALLVEPLVHPAVFFSLAIARPLLMAPVYYLFGPALRRRRDPVDEEQARPGVERHAPARALLPPLPVPARRWSPTMVNSTVAGATGMPALPFFALAILGTVARVTLIYFLGDVLSTPLREFADFVGKYQWYITPVTFSLGTYFLWRMWRKNRRFPLESVDEFDAELRESALELQAEATVTSPPEPD